MFLFFILLSIFPISSVTLNSYFLILLFICPILVFFPPLITFNFSYFSFPPSFYLFSFSCLCSLLFLLFFNCHSSNFLSYFLSCEFTPPPPTPHPHPPPQPHTYTHIPIQPPSSSFPPSLPQSSFSVCPEGVSRQQLIPSVLLTTRPCHGADTDLM